MKGLREKALRDQINNFWHELTNEIPQSFDQSMDVDQEERKVIKESNRRKVKEDQGLSLIHALEDARWYGLGKKAKEGL